MNDQQFTSDEVNKGLRTIMYGLLGLFIMLMAFLILPSVEQNKYKLMSKQYTQIETVADDLTAGQCANLQQQIENTFCYVRLRR